MDIDAKKQQLVDNQTFIKTKKNMKMVHQQSAEDFYIIENQKQNQIKAKKRCQEIEMQNKRLKRPQVQQQMRQQQIRRVRKQRFAKLRSQLNMEIQTAVLKLSEEEKDVCSIKYRRSVQTFEQYEENLSELRECICCYKYCHNQRTEEEWAYCIYALCLSPVGLIFTWPCLCYCKGGLFENKAEFCSEKSTINMKKKYLISEVKIINLKVQILLLKLAFKTSHFYL